jgi:hypothetical protein
VVGPDGLECGVDCGHSGSAFVLSVPSCLYCAASSVGVQLGVRYVCSCGAAGASIRTINEMFIALLYRLESTPLMSWAVLSWHRVQGDNETN